MCNEDELFSILRILILCCSVLSLLASILIIVIYVVYKDIQTLSFKILVCISVSDLLRSIALIYPMKWYNIKFLCYLAAIISNCSLTTNAVWSIYIMFIVSQLYSSSYSEPKLYFKTWFIIAFVLSPIFHTLPLITNSYGQNEGICTYKNDDTGLIWRTIQQSLITLVLLIALILYSQIFIKLINLKILTFKEIIFEKGMIYSIIFVVAICLILAYRLSEISLGLCDNFPLAVLSYGLLSLHGFLNFLATFYNRNFRGTLLLIFCCKKSKRSESVDFLDLIRFGD